MVARQKALLAIALGIAVVGVGCGGSSADSSSSSSSASPSKAEFVKQANEACERYRDGLGEKISSFLKQRSPNDKPSPAVYADLAHSVLLPMIESQLGTMYNLGAPNGDAKGIDELLYAEKSVVDELALTEKIASIRAIEKRFKQSGKLFRAYGLSSCANDPKPQGGTL